MPPETREDRVRLIMRQMAEGEWPEPGLPACLEHRQQLAAEWGVAEATIRHYAAEASRNLRADQGEREYLRLKLASRMRKLAKRAERRENAITKLPDWRAAIDAWGRYGQYLGLDTEEEAARPEPPTIVVQYADDRPIQSPAEPDAPGAPPGDDGCDPVGTRRR